MIDFFAPLFCYRVITNGGKTAINELHLKNIPIYNIVIKENEISFYIRAKYIKWVYAILRKYPDIKISCERKRLLAFLYKNRKRYGILAGSAFFIFCIIFLSNFIWAVDISGNSSMSDEEIRNSLAEMGIKEGARIKNIDKNEVSMLLETRNPQYSFISVNIIGTRAKIEIREKTPEELQIYENKNTNNEILSNLIAKESGKIVRFEVKNGQTMYKPGDMAEKGELLVSGIVERKNGSYKTVRSEGKVFAETNRVFETTVNFEETKKIYTGKEYEEKSYIFLGKKIFSASAGKKSGSDRELIEYEDDLMMGNIKLPVRVRHKLYLEYVEKTELIDVDRAEILAYDRYDKYKRDNMASDSEILSENAEFKLRDDGIDFRFILSSVEDIAEERQFYYLPASYGNERENNG